MPDFQKPKINSANKTFWEEIKNEKFMLQKCNGCNDIFFPPRIICPECLSDDIKHIESSGRGVLYAFTEIRGRVPGFKTPFVIGLIELDENPGRFLSRIEAPYENLKIGQKMKVKYAHKKKFSIHTFIPE
jgi:uncharacterized OB-fold protein